jgi:hypothetical protein
MLALLHTHTPPPGAARQRLLQNRCLGRRCLGRGRRRAPAAAARLARCAGRGRGHGRRRRRGGRPPRGGRAARAGADDPVPAGRPARRRGAATRALRGPGRGAPRRRGGPGLGLGRSAGLQRWGSGGGAAPEQPVLPGASRAEFTPSSPSPALSPQNRQVRAGSDAPAHMALDGAALENLELLENSAGGSAGEKGGLEGGKGGG